MASTITFDSVYTKSGEKNGKPWTRWDFKAGDDRYSTFQKKLADKIQTGQAVTIEYEESQSNGYTNRTITDVLAGNQQAGSESQNGSQGASEAPVSKQGVSDKDTLIHRQTASKVAAQLLIFYPDEEQTTDTFIALSKRLVHFYAFGE